VHSYGHSRPSLFCSFFLDPPDCRYFVDIPLVSYYHIRSQNDGHTRRYMPRASAWPTAAVKWLILQLDGSSVLLGAACNVPELKM
jgi:hypothetical protein